MPISPTYPQTAILIARTAITSGSAMTYHMWTQVSVNGGVFIDTDAFSVPLASPNSGIWAVTTYAVDYPMDPGSTYVFGLHIHSISGTGTASSINCDLQVQRVNRNPTTSPLFPFVPPQDLDRERRGR